MSDSLHLPKDRLVELARLLHVDLIGAIFYRSGERKVVDHQTTLQKDDVLIVPKAWTIVKLTD